MEVSYLANQDLNSHVFVANWGAFFLLIAYSATQGSETSSGPYHVAFGPPLYTTLISISMLARWSKETFIDSMTTNDTYLEIYHSFPECQSSGTQTNDPHFLTFERTPTIMFLKRNRTCSMTTPSSLRQWVAMIGYWRAPYQCSR